MTSNPPTTGDIFRVLLGVRVWAVTAAGVLACVGGVLWTIHQVALAQSERVTRVETKVAQIDRMAEQLDTVARDVSAIRQALGVEQGWRRGLLQSLPGAEGE